MAQPPDRAPRVRWLGLFRPAPPVPVTLTNPLQIASKYRYWQKRVLVATVFGYALFYFVRKNLGVAMPSMSRQLGITKEGFGLFLTLHGVVYGVSKFANGFLADRANARVFMSAALLVSALVNLFFGLSSAVLVFGLLWMLNGWVQGMGFPPCARLMANWFSPEELATKFSIWNASHSIGAGLIVVLCSYLVTVHWRLCFLVPAAIAAAGAVGLWFVLPDTPPSVGLPEVAGTEMKGTQQDSPEEFRALLLEQVFHNKYIWLLSLANFFVYTIRYAVFDWGPTLLTEAKGITITHAGWMLVGFEACGLMGALLGGWVTDRLLGGRAARACIVYMVLAGLSVFLVWKLPSQSELLTTGLLCATGFFIYGPQCLLAIAAANLATKRAAATAIGLTGLFGYLSTVLSGWGFGRVVQHYGWDAGFAGLIGCAAAGTLLFVAAWPAKAHGYGERGSVEKGIRG
jgi:OPA family glycerol-3-phosphate transporter-like MFS transporter/OPA family sugar phosphate sensor protein UhpC-like MFS transporter